MILKRRQEVDIELIGDYLKNVYRKEQKKKCQKQKK